MNLEVIFDFETLKNKIHKLEKKSISEDFWNNRQSAFNTLKKIKSLKNKENRFDLITKEYELLIFHVELINNEENIQKESIDHLKLFKNNLEKFEIEIILNDNDDSRDAIISIHPGAGGKESQDWANMLFRMYKRWIDKQGFAVNILNYQDGEENGIKDVSIEVKGLNAYGYLKSERGVHRLVRISPFDSNSRRHTSFASIFVYPVIDDDLKINILESDLKIDTYRASGAGGQHVNKTDSAVRIKHMPSGIVVQCQNQRSQLKNKSIALKILNSKLYQQKIDKLNNEKNKLNDSKADISWGNQIRSYVFHPYNLIKDHRTLHQTSNVNDVLDGNLNNFIRKYLLNNIKNGK